MKAKRKAEYAGVDRKDEIKRLNRVIGQIEGVSKMLAEHRKLEDVLMQCKAIHSALKSVESRIMKSYLDAALDSIVKLEKKKDRQEKLSEFDALFKYSE